MNIDKKKDISDFIYNFNKTRCTNLIEFRLECEKKHVPLIRSDTENFLRSFLYVVQPKNILEIGTGVGYSATLFTKILEDCRITTLELINKRIEEAKRNFEKYGVRDRVEIIEGDAGESLNKLISKDISKDRLYDLIFIDCAKSHYKHYFNCSVKLAKPSAVIICDNVLLNGRTVSDEHITKHRQKTSTLKMREFLKYLNTSETNANTILLDIGDGLTFSIVKDLL